MITKNNKLIRINMKIKITKDKEELVTLIKLINYLIVHYNQ